MIDTILHDGAIIALIIKNVPAEPGVHFLTPDTFSQQLAVMSHPVGKIITPHFHNKVTRDIQLTQEVLVIRKGRLRVDFFSTGCVYLESRILLPGETILLASGGHGFEVLEHLEMIEIKQGPYAGEADKTRFDFPAGFRPAFGR
jgi:mannose-6-phosphate isomerase-like protein (cupin superfamily)